MTRTRISKFAATAAVLSALMSTTAHAEPVLMISIDGLRGIDISEPDKHGLEIPTLRALAATGAYADGVRGVLPTVTYPSHTTLITGVHPAKHGIAYNIAFDPEGKNQGGWMWYAEDIKVPTLWDTVKASGGKVASVNWPVSTGKREIDYHIPEYWRASTTEDIKLLRALATPGMERALEHETGYDLGQVRSDDVKDDARMAWSGAMMAAYKPHLMTLHLSTLDTARHKYGPDSPEARAELERIDRGLKVLIDKARAAMPDLVVAIVSDHGFADISKGLNLRAALAAEGLLKQDAKGNVADWDAVAWPTGGSAAIVLKDPSDQAVVSRVKSMLDRLARDPANGVAQVLDRQAIAKVGGTPDASFWVDMREGFTVASNSSPELVQDVRYKGMHGFSPTNDKLLSTFIVSGPSIVKKKLGRIDMRDIAPTLGAILDAPLSQHDGRVLPITTGK